MQLNTSFGHIESSSINKHQFELSHTKIQLCISQTKVEHIWENQVQRSIIHYLLGLEKTPIFFMLTDFQIQINQKKFVLDKYKAS